MELNIFWVFFKCKSSDFLFKQKQHLGINSGTWVLGGYRYASWIFLPLFFKGLMSIPEFILTPAGASAPVDRGGGQPASLVRLGNAKQRCLFHLPGLAILIRGKSRYRERNRQKHNQPKAAWVVRDHSPNPFSRERQITHGISNKGEDNCQKKKKRAWWTQVILNHLITHSPALTFPGLLSQACTPV